MIQAWRAVIQAPRSSPGRPRSDPGVARRAFADLPVDVCASSPHGGWNVSAPHGGWNVSAPYGGWKVSAPYGLADVFDLVLRPGPVLAPRETYEAKASRRQREWPEPKVMAWESSGNFPGKPVEPPPLTS